MKKYKTKEERLVIVLDICKKLKNFPTITGSVINLYDPQYEAFQELRTLFQNYIHQDDTNTNELRGFSGSLAFPEIGKTIEYILPIRKQTKPLFVLRA